MEGKREKQREGEQGKRGDFGNNTLDEAKFVVVILLTLVIMRKRNGWSEEKRSKYYHGRQSK